MTARERERERCGKSGGVRNREVGRRAAHNTEGWEVGRGVGGRRGDTCCQRQTISGKILKC